MLTPDKLKTGKSLRKTMQQSLSVVASNTLFCCTCAATKGSSTQEHATLSSGMSTSRRWIKLPLDTKLDYFSRSRGDNACGVVKSQRAREPWSTIRKYACVKSNYFQNGGQRACSNMKVYLQTIAVTKYFSVRKCASFLARRIFANWRI